MFISPRKTGSPKGLELQRQRATKGALPKHKETQNHIKQKSHKTPLQISQKCYTKTKSEKQYQDAQTKFINRCIT